MEVPWWNGKEILTLNLVTYNTTLQKAKTKYLKLEYQMVSIQQTVIKVPVPGMIE